MPGSSAIARQFCKPKTSSCDAPGRWRATLWPGSFAGPMLGTQTTEESMLATYNNRNSHVFSCARQPAAADAPHDESEWNPSDVKQAGAAAPRVGVMRIIARCNAQDTDDAVPFEPACYGQMSGARTLSTRSTAPSDAPRNPPIVWARPRNSGATKVGGHASEPGGAA